MSVSISLYVCGVPVCCLPVSVTGNKSAMAEAGPHVTNSRLLGVQNDTYFYLFALMPYVYAFQQRMYVVCNCFGMKMTIDNNCDCR